MFPFYTPEQLPHPLISASHPSLLRPSTLTPLTLLLLSYSFQAQHPKDGVLVAKYVGLENVHLHFFLNRTPSTPLDAASHAFFLGQSSPTPLAML